MIQVPVQMPNVDQTACVDFYPNHLIASSPPALEVSKLNVTLRGADRPVTVIRGLDFSLSNGEIGCLLGPSGCGKTTALRSIAGFVRPDSGQIRILGKTVSDAGVWVPPNLRGVGIVFQDYALFPHLSVRANVEFGLRKLAPDLIKARGEQMLDLVKLREWAERFPHELSGGQQQRVALARALAPEPQLLLLDEPFSNLDPDLREELAHELRDLLKLAHSTALLVTHDQYEAFALADTVGVMEQGRIAQWDTAYRLYHEPATRSVADFVGLGAFLPGVMSQVSGLPAITTEIGSVPIVSTIDAANAKAQADDQGQLVVLLRPDDVVHDDISNLRAEVIRKAFRGAQILYTLRLPSKQELMALVPSHHNHAIGEQIGIRIVADHVITFARR